MSYLGHNNSLIQELSTPQTLSNTSVPFSSSTTVQFNDFSIFNTISYSFGNDKKNHSLNNLITILDPARYSEQFARGAWSGFCYLTLLSLKNISSSRFGATFFAPRTIANSASSHGSLGTAISNGNPLSFSIYLRQSGTDSIQLINKELKQYKFLLKD